jgi:transposase
MSVPVTQPNGFIGCDVGKADIVIFDPARDVTWTIANEPKALATLAAGLDPACFVVCEATGGYEAALLDALTRAGRAVHRADARKVKAFIRSFGTLGKTDAIDARALARYGQERHAGLVLWQPPEVTRATLQALVLVRQDLLADRVAWNNRAKAPGAEHASAAIQAVIETLEAQIASLDQRIQLLIQESQTLARANEILQSIAGIGPKTAAALLALMPELGSLDRRQAAALAGLAPHPKQSGSSNAYRRIKGGRPEIRRALFMAAMAARNSKSNLGAFFQRLVTAGKKPLVALTALMRKIVVIANAKLRDDRAYN